ncbi:MAG TPA: hypothetical protein HA362_03875 [Nanoarchaeota archaeon]|nr:hypothetical protein [Nanoarchaeota archaeon]
MEIGLHRGVEDILQGYEGLQAPDAAEKQKVENSTLQEMFGNFELMLRAYGQKGPDITMRHVPAPEEIELFLHGSVEYEAHSNYQYVAGRFTTWLIQNSYNAGFNNFVLDTRILSRDSLAGLCTGLAGTVDAPIAVKITGSSGTHCCRYAHDARITADTIGEQSGISCNRVEMRAKSIGDLSGLGSKYCSFHADSIGSFLGNRSEHSLFSARYIHGHSSFNSARHITVISECPVTWSGLSVEDNKDHNKAKKALDMNPAWFSAFKTHDKKTLEWALGHIRKWHGNRIYFIHPNGEEERCR